MKSDSQLKHDVLDELKWEPSVNATNVGVEVRDGIVTLAGRVESFSEKWHAERAVQRVHGVRGLAVDVNVELPGLRQHTDADIAAAARNILDWATNIPKKSISVMVENGWLTLSGTVDWSYQRLAAAQAVRHLLGVTGLSDQIVLKSVPASDPHAVKVAIEAALKRRAVDSANSISVTMLGTEATLTGMAGSWSEREFAEEAAWCTAGVRSVVDRISVTYQ
ncbi:MAG: BON domain-containing protein [Burkholderiales bacterium]|nr:BON domain-containing protein [Burkholderiales bacterium]